jgi:hypothetical protein
VPYLSWVTIAYEIAPTPVFVPCNQGDYGAQELFQFQPNISVPAGAIIVGPTEGIPGPGRKYWVAPQNCNLGPTLPPWGYSDQNLHFSAAPAPAPGQ